MVEEDIADIAQMTGGASLDVFPFGDGEPLGHALEFVAAAIDLIGVAIILFGFWR